ncbi:hypothetical protein Cgig2_029118 [Carnegiea gigantea]|uniref:Uncharacterized protein n=1 Tax=Carnegiea gigantea TaxID=171969 RepID=A0A9Q1KLB9_9CARY|nr:hypothetical protein Cgig2_029118 [Carnegiea gigantea]
MKQIFNLFLISSLFLSFITHIQSTSLDSINQSLQSSEGGQGEENTDAADPMDPAAPNGAPFAMPDADGDDNVLTPATLLRIPEVDARDAPLAPSLSPMSNLFGLLSPGPTPEPKPASGPAPEPKPASGPALEPAHHKYNVLKSLRIKGGLLLLY